MPRPSVSVIVPSFGRPEELGRCLLGLGQLLYRPYEVVVVACEAGRAAIAHRLPHACVRVFRNDGTGVAAARNAGLAEARGDIVAFVDDDAVPEPTWLDHLVSAMEKTDAPVATGFVRGRNGISYQWRGRTIRRDGFIDQLPDGGEGPWVPARSAGAVMLEGTNVAFHRETLLRLGGFDPAYLFYMDDADVALRAFNAGLDTVLVPLAQVHHAFAPSRIRRRDRMPTDLFDIGRSLAIFLRAHLGSEEAPAALALHREGERRRIIRYMVSGHAEPRDLRLLLGRFDKGAVDGLVADFGERQDIEARDGQARFRGDEVPAVRVVSGHAWSRRRLRSVAAEAAAGGNLVSLFVFSPTTLYHRVRFDPAGYWEQSGGLFGRAERAEPLFRAQSFGRRLSREVRRVAKVRGIPESHA